MKYKYLIAALLCGGVISASAQQPDSSKNENSLTSQQTDTKRNKDDSIWGYSSHGRELFDVFTDSGSVIKAVDVDGYAHSGDMILGKTEELKMYGLKVVTGQEAPQGELHDKSAAIRYPSSGYKWPNGVVPYTFASNLGNRARQAMNYAINHWNTKTNVNLVPRTNQRDYILIQGGGGCSSWIGRQGGQQLVTLAEGCGNGAAVHEIGHAVGFFHEQTRTDRDNYVTIYWDKIQSGMAYNFNMMSTQEGQRHGKYDYYSIMHYRTTAFGINNAVTIWPKQGGVDTNYMGNGQVLSNGDLAATAAIYGSDSGNGQTYNGSLSGSNDSDIQPDGTWFQYSGGNLVANLQGPSNADFDLFLYRWNGSGWSQVSSSESPNSQESINYSASSGYYYYKVLSYSGSGSYRLTLQK
ncbi:M12 family metallopeptidase [Aliikangiella sp. IMCC44359]|uniref:M12 family metallopeptidase n=1 Tax=Aliikangiella sp. IMCC44359 TaxID=3459125 RepID=UPI00403B173E